MPCGIVELILCAWKEPQPCGWQGRHLHYRTVSVWPKPLQQPLPPMYALGTSQEASDFALAQLLGHKKIDTVIRYYAELDTLSAAREFDAIVEGELAKACPPRRARK